MLSSFTTLYVLDSRLHSGGQETRIQKISLQAKKGDWTPKIRKKKKKKESIVPAEEHDDAAADDVKPRLLLPQDPADPSALRRHFSSAPHLHRLNIYIQTESQQKTKRRPRTASCWFLRSLHRVDARTETDITRCTIGGSLSGRFIEEGRRWWRRRRWWQERALQRCSFFGLWRLHCRMESCTHAVREVGSHGDKRIVILKSHRENLQMHLSLICKLNPSDFDAKMAMENPIRWLVKLSLKLAFRIKNIQPKFKDKKL